jgi:hypothetical protein
MPIAEPRADHRPVRGPLLFAGRCVDGEDRPHHVGAPFDELRSWEDNRSVLPASHVPKNANQVPR